MTTLSARISAKHQRDYSPVSWTEYFDEAHDICIEQNETNDDESKQQQQQEIEASTNGKNSFRVYLKNFVEPYAPKRAPGERLDSSRVELSESELRELAQVPTLVALHGGGYSGLTWAQFTRHMDQLCRCRILAIDLRSHGDTKTTNDTQMDIDTLVSDVFAVTQAAHQRICGFPITPKVILIGHSMGGAIAVNCATRCLDALPSLAGFVIIDVVEGTAKDALPLMMSVIKTRPTRFPSLENAIEWSVRSGMAKNPDAARVSMPGNLVNISTGHLSIHDVPATASGEHRSAAAAAAGNLRLPLERHKFYIGVEQLMGQSVPSALLPARAALPPRVSALKGVCNPLPPTVPAPISQQHALAQSSGGGGGNADVIEEEDEIAGGSSESRPPINDESSSAEAGGQGGDGDGYKRPPDVDQSGYSWRTNLAKTQPFWNGWFDGLSQQLLAAPVQAKFLLLAGIDRLDRTLTIGQMQGKFMMKVLPKCGHAVHEDVPEQVAKAIADFLIRNKFASPIITSDTTDSS